MVYINPKFIIVEFLRNRLTDPRESRRPTQNTVSKTASDGTTEVKLFVSDGKSLSHIAEVTVNGATKNKWADYYIDFRDEKVIFFSGLNSEDNIEITFYEAEKNWIYWDKPEITLGKNQFPRLAVLNIDGSGIRLGNNKAPVEDTIIQQIDAFVKEKSNNQIFEIGGKNYTGKALAEYLIYQVKAAFEDYEDDLHPALYDYLPQGIPPGEVPWDEEYQAFHPVASLELKGINVGRC